MSYENHTHEQYEPIGVLAICVHPFFLTPLRSDKVYQEFLEKISKFYPTKRNNITVITPMEKIPGVTIPNNNNERFSWEDLQAELIENAEKDRCLHYAFPNTLIIKDLIAPGSDINNFKRILNEMKLIITPETQIILGGEYTQVCVLGVAFLLFNEFIQINEIKIRSDACVPYKSRFTGENMPMDLPEKCGIEYSEDGEYILLRRKTT